ncbi:MAG: OmpA family protein [Betaproteobacteria bacterium]|nr:OmpA family protein [Betaproteobacteria bacterium]
MRNQLAVVSVAAILVLSGCASTSEMTPRTRDTAIGAGVGAGTGALIGAIAGGGKGAAIGAAAGAGLGAIAGNVWSRKMEEQKQQMEQATAGTGVQVVKTPDNRLKLDIPSDISFDTGRADIKSNLKPVLDSFATSLTNNPGTQVSIIGHTDSSGSDAVNNPLSLNRAASTRDYLVSRGVSANRITIEGRGSRQPLVANDTPANRAKNRRVEIFVAEPQPAPQ